MLLLLTDIAASVNIPFTWGTADDLSRYADGLTSDLLYLEGFGEGEVVIDSQGALSDEYAFRIWLITPLDMESTVTLHRQSLEALFDRRNEIIQMLSGAGEIVGNRIRFQNNARLKVTDRQLNGILMTGKLLMEPYNLC